ncbi:serine-enriched protein [Gigaspora margarita]|uniref:Serine-enriched protein n=1 Tax=Gigaspora margarita TaxID=4874 RepID=A0A8H3XLG9_GIGMA|nr:serine-enriched protein [Gigaspora margarita]
MAITHFRDDLCQDSSQLFENADDYNVIIQIGIEPDFEEFKAHSVILRARCPYFKIALSDKWVKKIENTYYLPKPNISPAIFILILRYIYTGTLDLTDQPGFNILALLVAVDELLLDQLINHIQEHFIDKEYNWLKENFVMALPTISKLQSCKRIQDYIMKTIEPPINSESDIHDILAIANELALIQLIDRIQDLKVLPEKLYKSLIAYFLANLKPKNVILQPRNGLINIDSTIIKKKNARIIVGWIEGITAFTKKLFCKFSCIYRATYYGFDSEKFIKEISDSDYFLSKTSSKVLLIKIKYSDLTIGGHISSLSRWSSSKIILSFVWEAKQVLIFISLVLISNILTNHG